jgi:hypothetical protein
MGRAFDWNAWRSLPLVVAHGDKPTGGRTSALPDRRVVGLTSLSTRRRPFTRRSR